MESEGVLLTLIHEHHMMPQTNPRKASCCSRKDGINDGYFCNICEFFVHKKCCEEISEFIQHSSHTHTLQLQSKRGGNHSCDLCGMKIMDLCYHCEICDFDIDLYCAKYPPPDVIDDLGTHHHKLTLLKQRIKFACHVGYRCKLIHSFPAFPYKCYECDFSFHVDCAWHPIKYTTMDSERVSLPLIHKHLMVPRLYHRTSSSKANCCSRYNDISDGYYCKICDFFVHKRCCEEASEFIQHSSHTHNLRLQTKPGGGTTYCGLCGIEILDLCYRCEVCDFIIDLYCAKSPPPDVIDDFGTHHHKLTLVKEFIFFDCHAKGLNTCNSLHSFPYKCQECDLSFHVDCVWRPIMVNHSLHSLHPLKLYRELPPIYSDGKCRLCGTSFYGTLFYHCSYCNLSLDMACVLNPPPQSLLDLKAHDHQLTLLPRLDSFTCNACGLKGDRSPYVCLPCGFMIHQDCLDLPRVIQINRHDHRISRTSVLGALYSVCGVCRQKVDWTYGGYSYKRCPRYVVHSKCATNRYVWNGKELESVPEETEDIEPYVVIDDNTIQHFSHKEHHLRLQVNSLPSEDNKRRCNACTHPIYLQSFYGCIEGCEFMLHQKCAEFPQKKWHVLHNERLTLVTSEKNYKCHACDRLCNGFAYKHENKKFDVLCGSISEPFFHPSHPNHPFYYIPRKVSDRDDTSEICNGCNYQRNSLRCIEDGCEFAICFECATLPQTVKHRVDDHPLSLCYGEKASGKYWCDICEKETKPETWFYTCKDNLASLHTECVLGDFAWLMPGSTIEEAWENKSYEVVLNNSSSRPFCRTCKSHCLSSIILKLLGTTNTYICSWHYVYLLNLR